jgi:hypothetical protein
LSASPLNTTVDFEQLWLPMQKRMYFVIEHFKNSDAMREAYQRFAERGRMLPDGLNYIDSWVEQNFNRCFQLMETDQPVLFDQWIECWSDLVDFEVIPVIGSAAAAADQNAKKQSTTDEHRSD